MGADFTPGPWRWEVNLTSRIVQLCGGRPAFDKTVMGFKRWGMSSAAPCFQDHTHQHRNMTRADEFAVPVDGREHHYHWFQDIDQPDARLIAAAPELYEALRRVRDENGDARLINARNVLGRLEGPAHGR